MSKLAIGYDYGTTTSFLAVCDVESGRTRLVSNDAVKGFPSAVFIADDGEILYGERALRHRGENHFISPKRAIIANEFSELLPVGVTLYDIIEGFTKNVFESLKPLVSSDVDSASITVTTPLAFFDGDNRKMQEIVKNCFTRLYPEVQNVAVDVLPEPLAATVFALHSQQLASFLGSKGRLAVCDMGGGTTDLSLVYYSKGHDSNISIELLQAITHYDENPLGGDDITMLLLDYLRNEKGETNCDFSLAESYKKKLSAHENEVLPNEGKITREEFERLLDDKGVLENLRQKLCKLFKDVDGENIYVLPVGGSSKIPIVQGTYQSTSGGHTLLNLQGEYSEVFDSVVRGASAFSAYKFSEKSISLKGRTNRPLSVKWGNGRLYECVLRNSVDGTYYNPGFHPIRIEDDGFFTLGSFIFYESSADGGQQRPYCRFDLNDRIDARGRTAEEVFVEIRIEIKNSKPNKMQVIVTGDSSSPTGLKLHEDIEHRFGNA